MNPTIDTRQQCFAILGERIVVYLHARVRALAWAGIHGEALP